MNFTAVRAQLMSAAYYLFVWPVVNALRVICLPLRRFGIRF
jgi:hypothetical protein